MYNPELLSWGSSMQGNLEGITDTHWKYIRIPRQLWTSLQSVLSFLWISRSIQYHSTFKAASICFLDRTKNTYLCNNRLDCHSVHPVLYYCELSNQSIQKTAPQEKEEGERIVFHQEEICGRELLQSSWHCHQHLTFTQPSSLGESQHSSDKLQIPLRWNQTNPRESRNC